MAFEYFIVLSEQTRSEDIVDDDAFTVVSADGEVYTSYRIVRFTHAADYHPDGWTHAANVSGVHQQTMGVALLKVTHREIVRAEVTLADLT